MTMVNDHRHQTAMTNITVILIYEFGSKSDQIENKKSRATFHAFIHLYLVWIQTLSLRRFKAIRVRW